jgi:lysophospholipase L1-like esterase
MAGTENTGVLQVLASYGELACHIVNGQTAASGGATNRFWSFLNMGWGAQTYAQTQARLAGILAKYQPDAMLIPTGSPNSSASTQANQDDSIGRFLDMVAQCAAARVIPILVTEVPWNSLNATQDGFRKARNQLARNVAAVYGYPLADVDLVTSTQASPAQWIPGLSTDGLHPNATGKAAMAAVVAATLKSAFVL